ncbi:MAG TPA: response regulator [Kofleriaceae bacterium]|nr:response regulator [Kofleriaceae bacterium]
MGSILLVEADSVIGEQWSAALTAEGHAVFIATTMRDVLPVIREGGIDVVVIDAYDPRAGVVELARSIEAVPDAPPLILVSGSPSAPEISARIGAAAFLTKPCDLADLMASVSRVSGAVRPVLVPDDDLSGPTIVVQR